MTCFDGKQEKISYTAIYSPCLGLIKSLQTIIIIIIQFIYFHGSITNKHLYNTEFNLTLEFSGTDQSFLPEYKAKIFCFFELKFIPQKSQPQWLSWMRHPNGDQEVGGSSPAEAGNIFSWRLIMKYFLRSFSPFH